MILKFADLLLSKNRYHMKKIKAFLLWTMRHWKVIIIVCLMIVLSVVSLKMYRKWQSSAPLFAVTHNTAIESTPDEIRAMKEIRKWEFLSLTTEELVEYHEPHSFGDKHLVKIFKGTLSLGIDLQMASDDWFRADSTVAYIQLPSITLLDESFIDEANTVTFYEKGSFSAKVKQELYDKAAEGMKKRALSTSNIEQAQQSAEEQFTKLFKSLGYTDVVVAFSKNNKK